MRIMFFAKDANEITDEVKEILSHNPNDFDKISIVNSEFMNNAVSDVSVQSVMLSKDFRTEKISTV